MKSRDGQSQSREEKKKEDNKGRKVAKHCVFPMICGSGGSKSRLAKATGAEPAGQMRDEQCVLAKKHMPVFRLIASKAFLQIIFFFKAKPFFIL